jgi:hypothetical protein
MNISWSAGAFERETLTVGTATLTNCGKAGAFSSSTIEISGSAEAFERETLTVGTATLTNFG